MLHLYSLYTFFVVLDPPKWPVPAEREDSPHRRGRGIVFDRAPWAPIVKKRDLNGTTLPHFKVQGISEMRRMN